jgi:ATP-dependent Clp protease, protease subunit
MKKHFHKTIKILLLSLFFWISSGFIVAQTSNDDAVIQTATPESQLEESENTVSDSEESPLSEAKLVEEKSVLNPPENITEDSEDLPSLIEEETVIQPENAVSDSLGSPSSVELETVPIQLENAVSDSLGSPSLEEETLQNAISDSQDSPSSIEEETVSIQPKMPIEAKLLFSIDKKTLESAIDKEPQFLYRDTLESVTEEEPLFSDRVEDEYTQLPLSESTTAEPQSVDEDSDSDNRTETDSTVTQQSSSPITITEYNLNNPVIKALVEQLQRLKLENAIFATQNLIQAEKYQWEISQLQQEKRKLQLMNELQQEKQVNQLAQLQADRNQLLLDNELYAAEQNRILAELSVIKTRLELENHIQKQETQKFLAKLNAQREQLAIQNAIAVEKQKQEELKIQLKTAKLAFDIAQFEFEKNKRALDREELSEKISEREQREQWESQVNKPIRYLKKPLVDGYLVISDRKIEIGEVILPNSAAYVNERIHYYNNKNDEYPIFLIIDVCYGGSVMEGAKILEAMHSSRAPVYVVVKTMAASLAAVITTLAEESYAYPNAILLHHQLFGAAEGNPQQIKEQLEMAQEWTQRIMRPVAAKMGITVETFVQQMYENNSSGEWFEFADVATKLKWVNRVIKDIRDTSITKFPTEKEVPEEEQNQVVVLKAKEQSDSQGQPYVKLPRLNPLDMYFLYNPNNYYR